MAKPMFIWLGSGRARRRKVGARGRWLDAASGAGLPVPPGAVLLDEFYRFADANALIDQSGGRAFVPDAEMLANTIFHSLRLPRLVGPIDVRPVFSIPDGVDLPPACWEAERQADPDDAIDLARALAAAWSARAPAGDAARLRRDVLLLQTVAARTRGAAFSADDQPEDRARMGEETIALPRLGQWSGPDRARPPYLGRLQMLLRGLRRTLGRGDWIIDWADDGRFCWLTRVESGLSVE